ncbi:glycosyltransferase family 4 protein [Corynebacterium caspium]|uniref:glycosyltransferase family 4 protein n=1 Tax=Corynebacterium caspium TaxID=234828 RepID=UPI0003795601|nr:glycosyltransferase family 4 protein [Corynebacterium caspium]WKD59171.1 GDP-mannose-dependent alpha-(1-2)-phosphatidylinositol mannosyltransferase [Corynebacterium caspium DSM 44850]
MRIGIVCPYSFDEPGGVQAHIIDLADTLISLGHEVSVIGPAIESTPLPGYITKGGSSIPVRYNGSVARLAIGKKVTQKIKDFINNGNFDILHIHEPNSPSFSMMALRFAEGPIVATYHTSSTDSKLLRIALPVLRPLLEKIRGGIAVSEMARRWQVEMLGGDPILIPNGVRTAKFRAAYMPPDPNKPVEIVFLGRIDEPRKGLNILLAALESVSVKVKVTVIGGGEARNIPGIDFVGRVSEEEKAKILGRADIYVAPNTGGESFGIVLVEAMAAGCAVVASDLEAFRAVAAADSCQPAARLFATGSPRALASTLNELIADPQQRAELVSAGLTRALDFEWDSVALNILAVYKTVADGTKVKVQK